MPRTGAERQAAWRKRRARLIADLERTNARLWAELDRVRADLAAALADVERLTDAACKHPAAAVDGSTCRACGADDVW